MAVLMGNIDEIRVNRWYPIGQTNPNMEVSYNRGTPISSILFIIVIIIIITPKPTYYIFIVLSGQDLQGRCVLGYLYGHVLTAYIYWDDDDDDDDDEDDEDDDDAVLYHPQHCPPLVYAGNV